MLFIWVDIRVMEETVLGGMGVRWLLEPNQYPGTEGILFWGRICRRLDASAGGAWWKAVAMARSCGERKRRGGVGEILAAAGRR